GTPDSERSAFRSAPSPRYRMLKGVASAPRRPFVSGAFTPEPAPAVSLEAAAAAALDCELPIDAPGNMLSMLAATDARNAIVTRVVAVRRRRARAGESRPPPVTSSRRRTRPIGSHACEAIASVTTQVAEEAGPR